MISILMPAKNAGRYIAEAINSILLQSLTEWELIVVNDDSTDDTQKRVDQFVGQDKRIRMIESSGAGVSDARNTAIEAARFDICVLADADDVMVPNRLELQHSYLVENLEVIACGGAMQAIDVHGKELNKISPSLRPKSNFSGFPIVIPHVPTPVMALRREPVLKLGGFRTWFKQAEDIDLLLRMEEQSQLVNLPDILCKYRIHGDSTSSQNHGTQAEFFSLAVGLSMQRRKHGIDGLDTGATCIEDLGLDEQDIEKLRHQRTVSHLNSHNRQRRKWNARDEEEYSELLPYLKEHAPTWVDILTRERV